MLIHEIDDLLSAKPFVPFKVVMADGRALLVAKAEYAWHPGANRTMWIATGSDGGRFHMIDLQDVTQFVL